MECRRCGEIEGPREIVLESGPHYGKHECPLCGSFLGFMKKPVNEKKRAKNKYTAESLGYSACQLCQREKDRLGVSEVLEVHHVKEISQGGDDIPANIWCVCTPCHKIIHHQRIYTNEHQKTKITRGQLLIWMDQHMVPNPVMSSILKIWDSQNER